MRRFHRFSLNVDESIRRALARFGIEVDTGLVAFEVEESHQHWTALYKYLQKLDAVDLIGAKFSQTEIDAAPLLNLKPAWHFGYPQPEAGFGYLNVEGCRKLLSDIPWRVTVTVLSPTGKPEISSVNMDSFTRATCRAAWSPITT